MPSETEDRAALRGAGLKITGPRLAVLAALDAHPHSDADTLFRAVRETLPTSLPAVYAVLGSLAEAGLVRRLELGGPSARWDRGAHDEHHHAVCRACGAVVDLPLDLDDLVAEPADGTGFAVETVELTLRGLCPDCLAAGIPRATTIHAIPDRRRNSG